MTLTDTCTCGAHVITAETPWGHRIQLIAVPHAGKYIVQKGIAYERRGPTATVEGEEFDEHVCTPAVVKTVAKLKLVKSRRVKR